MDRSILDEILEEAEAEEATYFTAYGQREVNGSYYYQHGYNPLSEGSRSRGKSFETFDRRLTAEPEQWDDSSTRTHGGDLGYDSTKWANDRVMEMPRATAYHPQSPKKFDLSRFTPSPLRGPKNDKRPVPSSGKMQTQHGVSRSLASKPKIVPTARKQVSDHGGISLGHAPPVVQGIPLVPVHRLPDRLRSLFPFELFNAVQSKVFETVYNSNDNIVLSSPTGSGKTIVLELAVCRAIETMRPGTYKVIYQAPTKALCAEKKRDWDRKYATLGLKCTELTGDTDVNEISHVKEGDIIITTPEKWDSVTRRWEDHKRLLQMVKVFLVDEVHSLKESRGATLEVVISRMKSLGIDVRFVALSATIPNSGDIAAWIGKNSAYPTEPAFEARFGEEFRPVKLEKFVYGYPFSGNDYMFDKSLDKYLCEVIRKHAEKKPVMIFCMTRQICVTTAKFLAESSSKSWPTPSVKFTFDNKDLHATALCGVGFHHAGLDQKDRLLLERLYLEGHIAIICCTSTLAVGINLPAHLVILKNTLCFYDSRARDYDDLDIMQTLGRAGRPQFDTSGVAVIMTKKESQKKYENMVSGSDPVESCLHLNLVEHLNAEIDMGTITDMSSAKLWLKSTFLWHRMKSNPSFYKLEGQTVILNIEQTLDEICEKDVKLLESEDLVCTKAGRIICTPCGHAMANYYVKFETMKTLLSLKEKAKVSDILTAISEAQEFKDLRIRHNEKSLYKEINRSIGMKHPIKGDISSPAHKAYILIQFELGALELLPSEAHQKQSPCLIKEKNFIFQHARRISRCLIDCLTERKDAVALKNGLEVVRSLISRCWENSPNQLRQLEGIGPATVKKLVMANIRTLEGLVGLEPYKIDMIASRNPPFGSQLLKEAQKIPQFTISVNEVSRTVLKKKTMKVLCEATLGYANKPGIGRFQGRGINAVFLAECDGVLLDFRRIAVFKLETAKSFRFTAVLSRPEPKITCYLSCEDIVGTMKSFELHPDIDPALFPPIQPTLAQEIAIPDICTAELEEFFDNGNGSTPTVMKAKPSPAPSRRLFSRFPQTKQPDPDEYDDPEFLAAVDDMDFDHIDNLYSTHTGAGTKRNKHLNSGPIHSTIASKQETEEPIQLPNGKWACKHKCTDKTKCKHLCCREGLDKPPKAVKKRTGGLNDNQSKISIAPVQTATSTQNIIRSMGSFKKRPIVSRFPNLAYQSQPLDSDGIGMDTGADDEPYSSSSEIARPYQRLAQLHYKATTERASSVTKRLQQETATEPGLPKLKDYENGAHNDRERVSTTQTISSEGYVPGVFLTSEPDHRSTIDIKEHIAYPPDYMSSDLEQSMKSGYEPVELASSKRKLGAFLASDEWSTIDDFSVQETKSTTRGELSDPHDRIKRTKAESYDGQSDSINQEYITSDDWGGITLTPEPQIVESPPMKVAVKEDSRAITGAAKELLDFLGDCVEFIAEEEFEC